MCVQEKKMHLTFFFFGMLLLVKAEVEDSDWVDPTDMLHYDATSKSMKRENYSTHHSILHLKGSNSKSEKDCNPVFKRYLNKLLRDIQKIGLPDHVVYDAEIHLTRQSVSEITKFLDSESWKPAVMDEALSHILVNFKPHDYEAWKWRFEDTFGIELEALLKVLMCVLLTVLIICTEVWSKVSWTAQFKRLFAVCFFISIPWNWLYLYKIAFAEHQKNMVKMEHIQEKCTGIKEFDWKDNLLEWYRSTFTLRNDPCKEYYEHLVVNPILIVPPTKAIAVTFTTFVTEPLKHVGQGISEFLRALLKDLPITLQIPVVIIIAVTVVILCYGCVQSTIQHCVFRRPLTHQDPPPPPPPPALPTGGAIHGETGFQELNRTESRERSTIQNNQSNEHLRYRNVQNRASTGNFVEAMGPTDRPITQTPYDEWDSTTVSNSSEKELHQNTDIAASTKIKEQNITNDQEESNPIVNTSTTDRSLLDDKDTESLQNSPIENVSPTLTDEDQLSSAAIMLVVGLHSKCVFQ
ncbi:chloride channel CLIC-like protein 1 isoform X7 [Erpetoichthys calabaricus]|uniref:chloride channel CLIC-like protein 1 isoform X7 n=1 Tax=Erpetoichthys calabaricus TaxID=27687 RepID=UPI0022340140|nr:chloride channel CLIC-like protein 1 isoform X7 [Erpetoichthys calabaricus]